MKSVSFGVPEQLSVTVRLDERESSVFQWLKYREAQRRASTMNICLIGPSGAGKGTHTVHLAEKFGLVQLSTGNLLRENLDKRTALGILADKYMAQGELVPDEVVEAMIEEKLHSIPAKSGIVFDGFPRTVEQAKFLDALSKRVKRRLDVVVSFRISDEEVVKRVTGRLICTKCLAPFHKTYRTFNECPSGECRGEHLSQRMDDTAAIARNRLRVLQRSVGPVLHYYQQSGRLVLLNADGDADSVGSRLNQAIESVRSGKGEFATAEDLSKTERTIKFIPLIVSSGANKAALNLLLLGAPGCGKGTQADLLSRQFNLRHFAPGDLFIEHLKNQTELGLVAKSYMDQGELVPDDITDTMISERLAQPDTSDGFILDGFPRNARQASALKEMLAALRRKLSGVLHIKVPDDEIGERLSGRVICRQCHTPYHLKFKPPAHAGLCDLCRSPLSHPDDDTPEAISARLNTFHSQTEPLIDGYRAAGLLVEVDGTGTVDAVGKAVFDAAKRLADPGHFEKFRPRTSR